MKLRRVLIGLAIAILATALIPAQAHALECGIIPQSVCDQILGDGTTAPVTTAADAARPLIDWVVNILFAVFGTVMVLVLIISGIQISASAGNEEIVKKGKENIFKAVTAIVLLISFRAIFELIERAFEGVNTTNVLQGNGLNPEGIPRLLENVVGIASLVAGTVAVIFIIVGGIQYIGSGGGEGITKAKKTITYAVAGLVISILAYTIVSFISGQLQ